MRLLFLILFVGTILAEENAEKPADVKTVVDVKDAKKPAEETDKSKTGKRDSSDQTGNYITNSNDEPFRPIIGLSHVDPYQTAAATQQATYYDKSQLAANDGGGRGIEQQRQHQKQLQHQQQQQQQFTAHDAQRAKDETINRHAVGAAYQRPYSSQVIYQQQQQQQPLEHQQQQQQLKQLVRVAVKNNGNQQKDILYATPHNAAYNYERLPVQYQQQQLQHQAGRGPGGGAQQRPPQQIQYVIAIPMSYLRQLQQQLQQEQQQQQQYQQPYKAGQQQQQQQQQQPYKAGQQQQQQQQQQLDNAAYTIPGPLARDHQGTYRPFHRFAPAAVTDVQAINAAGHQQQQPQQQQNQYPPAPPGYVTQYIQIPASVLLAAAQSAQVYQRPMPQPVAYQQHHQPQNQQQEQHQQQQQQQQQSPQFYYYYPTSQQHEHQHGPQQQHQPPQQQLKQLSISPPLYAYQIQAQQQQPGQQPQHHQQSAAAATTGALELQVQNLLAEQQRQLQHQFQVGGKEQALLLRSGGGSEANANSALAAAAAEYQHGPLVTYERGQQAIAAAHQQAQAQAQAHIHSHQVPQTQAHNPHHHEPAQVLTVPQESAQKTVHPIPKQPAPAPPPAAEHSYEPIAHYNPHYLVQYLPAQQQKPLKYQQSQPQSQPQLQHVHLHPHLHPHHQHRLQLQAAQQQTTIVDNLNNLPYSQGIHGPTPVPFVHLAPGVHVTSPAMNGFYHHHPFVASSLQPGFAPLGMPSKVTSFTNVLLQPFGHGHGRSYEGITPEIGAAGNSLPYFNQVGGIHYGTHLYHPPTPATPLANKQPGQHSAVAGVASAAPSAAIRASSAQASTKAKAVKGDSRTIVKYP